MPSKCHMTWLGTTRRWKKMYRGTVYVVSCRELGAEGTKEGSWRAANAWWEERRREADASPVDPRKSRARDIGRLVRGFSALDEPARKAAVEAILGEGAYEGIKARKAGVTAEAEATAPGRATAVQVEEWTAQLRAACQSGQMSTGRFDAYARRIRPFAGFAPSLDAIGEDALDGFYAMLSGKVRAGEFSPATAHEHFATAKQFVRWLAERRRIPLPGNIDSRRFRFKHSAAAKIETFTVAEVRAYLDACEGFSDATRLYILLMIQCGMYQNDIAELRQDEVDWRRGTIRRARSKTRDRNGPVVTYKLWPETFALLGKLRAPAGDLVLLTEKGNPLVREWIEGGAYRKYDAIRSAWERLNKKMGMRKGRLGLKHLRKTGATLLGGHPTFKFYATHFLADSPKGMSLKHYVNPSDPEFFEALDWLRGQILGPEGR